MLWKGYDSGKILKSSFDSLATSAERGTMTAKYGSLRLTVWPQALKGVRWRQNIEVFVWQSGHKRWKGYDCGKIWKSSFDSLATSAERGTMRAKWKSAYGSLVTNSEKGLIAAKWKSPYDSLIESSEKGSIAEKWKSPYDSLIESSEKGAIAEKWKSTYDSLIESSEKGAIAENGSLRMTVWLKALKRAQ